MKVSINSQDEKFRLKGQNDSILTGKGAPGAEKLLEIPIEKGIIKKGETN